DKTFPAWAPTQAGFVFHPHGIWLTLLPRAGENGGTGSSCPGPPHGSPPPPENRHPFPEGIGMSSLPSRPFLLAALTGLVAAAALPAQNPDQQAQMLLAGARRAYNEKNYPFAAARFRDFLSRFASHRDAPSARYGLALCLLD